MSNNQLLGVARTRVLLFATIYFLILVSVGQALDGLPPVRHITTYQSPSKRFSVTIDPTQLHGGGPCQCRVERDSKLVWEKQIDFTFWEAVITDEGVTAGYGYTAGWDGIDANGTNGDIAVAILSPDGNTKFIDRRPRNNGAIHAPPDPIARGCFLDQFAQRFVVRFSPKEWQEGGEVWETYSLNENKRSSDIRLSKPGTT